MALAGALLAGASPVSAATRVVDDDRAQCPAAAHTTIQSAVDASGAGDTVIVCNGRYVELVTIAGPDKRGLRLRANVVRGATIQAPPGEPAEPLSAIVRITGAATGVEVSRFVVERAGDTGAANFGLLVDQGATVGVMRHNTVRNLLVGIRFGTGVNAPANWGRDVGYNRVEEHQSLGIQVIQGGANVHHNTLTTSVRNAGGMLAQDEAALRATSNVLAGPADGVGVTAVNVSRGLVLSGNRISRHVQGISLLSVAGGLVKDNVVREHQSGILVDGGSGNRLERNDARGGGTWPDCEDRTTGAGTAGTANTWIANRGLSASPPGICRP